MKTQLWKGMLATVAAVGLLTGSAMAVTVEPPLNGEPSLQDIFDANHYNVGVNTNQSALDSYWQVNAGGATGSWQTVISISGDTNITALGIFDQSGHEINILSGANLQAGYKVTMTWIAATGQLAYSIIDTNGVQVGYWNGINMDSTFGFYIGTAAGNLYSDASKNGGLDVLNAYNLTGTGSSFDGNYVLAFDDGNGDNDFNDLVLLVESIHPVDPHNPVPEPATMLLFGAGLLGLSGIARRRMS